MEWSVGEKAWPEYLSLILDQHECTVDAWWRYIEDLGVLDQE